MLKNLSKQFKKKVIGVPQDALLMGPDGLGDIFKEELENACERLCLPYKSRGTIALDRAQIELSDWDFRSLIELCQSLKTCREFWWKISSQHVGSLKEFKSFVKKIDWELYIPKNANVYLKVDSFKSKLYHEGLLKEEVENILQEVDYQLTQHELNSTFKILITQKANRTDIYLSMNGEALYKRNYKQSFYAKAPIKEHLAASLCRLLLGKVNLTRDDIIYVPFAGSGTLGFEAILNFYDLRPMLWRDDYAMKNISGYPEASQNYLDKTAKSELKLAESHTAKVKFLELDNKAIESLQKNITAFRSVSSELDFDVIKGDFFEYTTDEFQDKNIVIALNPPYGLRLKAGDNKTEFYKQIALKINDLSEGTKSFLGFCLLPDEKSSFVFCDSLRKFDVNIRHITQGGQHIRVAVFARKI